MRTKLVSQFGLRALTQKSYQCCIRLHPGTSESAQVAITDVRVFSISLLLI